MVKIRKQLDKVMIIAKSKPKHLCQAKRCKACKAPKKKFCSKHHAQSQKQNNLVGYTYNLLKQNAKTRKKVFTITLQDFKDFCNETGYLETKGRTKLKSSIDRKDHTKGYEKGNLQLLSVSDNSKKRWEDEAPF